MLIMQNVTFITDLGLEDHYAAVLKAKIMERCPAVRFIDVSHQIAQHNILDASFLCQSTYPHFPKGTIHIVLVQSYYTFKSELLVYEFDGQYFIVPNNGILSLVFSRLDRSKMKALKLDKLRNPFVAFEQVGHAVACIKNGLLEDIGDVPFEIEEKIGLQPVTNKSEIRATIIHIDHFENVITNLSREVFDKIGEGRPFDIFYKNSDPLDRICKNYSDVGIGDPLCFFNSSGYLEIAINTGKASSLYGLYKNETIQINFYS